MADVFAYLYGFGAGGDFTKSVIIVTAPTGSTVTCTKGTMVKTATEKNGEWWFKNLDTGTWTVKATLSGQTATQTVNVTQFGVYRVAMVYRLTPEFTYIGKYKVVQDNDSEISDFANWKGNWKIRFLTSGKFTVTNMHGWNGKIDVFLVGAGAGGGKDQGGGGGAGYTKVFKNMSVSVGHGYTITIGAGGPSETTGGATSAFSNTANGGTPGESYNGSNRKRRGGNGGSGGAYGGDDGAGTPGTDGNNGSGDYGGTGQGSTTREFGEPGGKLYSAGGIGGTYQQGSDSVSNNTGDGGQGGMASKTGGKGASGIVIIRNAR